MGIADQGYLNNSHVNRYYEYQATLSPFSPSGEPFLFGLIIDTIVEKLIELDPFNSENVSKRSGLDMGEGVYARVYLKSILNNTGNSPGTVNSYLTDLVFEVFVNQTYNLTSQKLNIDQFITCCGDIFDKFNLDNLHGLVRKVSPEIEFPAFRDKEYNRHANAIITLTCERYLENWV